ncbi:MAG TPA: KpsF/GutQ family sugar-phosphate isomerase [Chitinophagaceae bacterium]|nr:KpsF/GutQ family sugar-phosphate isomerase [Chitinophagaceae bacterium]
MTKTQDIQGIALKAIRAEAASVSGLQQYINADFERAVQAVLACKGRLVVSGIGKSAIIAQKIVATLNSTGTPSLYMHAADAIHGDLGMVQQQDVVMVISKSGNSPEIKVLVPLVKNFGNILIGVVGNEQSLLAKQADMVLNTTVEKEACPNNLAPTSSTTAQMVMGDAFAVCLMELKGFGSEDFARYHPGGVLGKQLYLRVKDLYIHNEKPAVQAGTSLKEIIISISAGRLGVTAVVNEQNEVLGVITDGDLRRMLEKNENLTGITAEKIMTADPKTIEADSLAVNALNILRQYDITQLVVTSGKQYLGVLHLHDLVREGLI